jgi:hypothetical protein
VRSTRPPPPPPGGISILGLVGSTLALLVALGGVGVVMTSSKKELGGSSALLTALFGTVAIAAVIALIGSLMKRR